MQIIKEEFTYSDVTISRVTPQKDVKDADSLDNKVVYSVLKQTEQKSGKQSIMCPQLQS